MVVRNITILDHVVGETEVETVATTVVTAGISAVVSREATSVVKFICVHQCQILMDKQVILNNRFILFRWNDLGMKLRSFYVPVQRPEYENVYMYYKYISNISTFIDVAMQMYRISH